MTLQARPVVIAITPLLLAPLAAAFAPQATPVNPSQSQGKFSSFPSLMTVGNVTTTDPLLIRAPGINSGIPLEWNATDFTPASAQHPDFRASALAHWAVGWPAPQYGGISTGGEVMPEVTSGGELQMATINWYMLSVTVDKNARGVTGSVLEMQVAGGRDPSGDIFSYYAIGSTGIHPDFEDSSRLESSRLQLRLEDVPPIPSGTPPPPPRSILNLDYGGGVRSVNPQARWEGLFPVGDSFYFTLTQAYVDSAPGLDLDGVPIDASTIYGMHWGGSPLAWSAPERVFEHADLFDEGVDIGEVEIDALSVDRGGMAWDAPKRAVISLTPASDTHGPFEQILVHQRNVTPFAVPMMTDSNFGTSQTFTEKLGFRTPETHEGDPTNVTGTCGGDPDERYRLGPVVAIATDQQKRGGGKLGLSMMRTCPHATLGGAPTDVHDTLNMQITGMDYAPHMFGVIQIYSESASVPSGPPGPSTAWGDPLLVDSAATLLNAINLSGPIACALQDKQLRFSAMMYGVDFTPGLVITPMRESWVLSMQQ